ncbi:hypothetical protein A2U01_0109059, partial [Trifolium medium]|nr:hypothetical protein [Trifolium medium]
QKSTLHNSTLHVAQPGWRGAQEAEPEGALQVMPGAQRSTHGRGAQQPATSKTPNRAF